MLSLRFLVLLACLLSIARAQDAAPVSTHALFDHEIRRVVEETGVHGAAYAIVVDRRIETARGFGVRELGSQEPISAHTVFRIASVSKTFAAQLAAMLVDEGRLDWKLPLPRFAPDFRLKGGGESEAFPAPVTVPSQAEARGAKAPTKPSS